MAGQVNKASCSRASGFMYGLLYWRGRHYFEGKDQEKNAYSRTEMHPFTVSDLELSNSGSS
jgi:hypothetical protein